MSQQKTAWVRYRGRREPQILSNLGSPMSPFLNNSVLD